ncbi:MAG: isoprenyl transferase [Chlorobi bacterium]|nr:isoprenyl transferase [Chlorobiota bacterium]
MNFSKNITKENVPVHIAIIMDGNGRWAKKKGNKRIFGHKNGVKAVKQTVEAAGEAGVKYLTLYAFSSENWNRPKVEVDALMALLISAVKNETENLMNSNVRVQAIGDISALPESVTENLNQIINKTKNNTGLTLILALSYSARNEITNAVKQIASEILSGKIKPETINENTISNRLYTHNIPDPELLIRTSGEYRLSNFLLWQISYAELYFTDTLWPDFKKEDFFKAIYDFQQRERRFGKTSEQIKEKN